MKKFTLFLTALMTICCLAYSVMAQNNDTLRIGISKQFIVHDGRADAYPSHMPILSVSGNTVFCSIHQHDDIYISHPVDAMRISNDNGVSWPVYTRQQDFYFSSLIKLISDTLFGMDYIGYYLDSLHARCHFWQSPDNGATWIHDSGTVTFPENITELNLSGWSSILFYRTMIQMPDGSLQGTMYGKYVGDLKYRCLWVKSIDGGVNWNVVSTIAYDGVTGAEGFCEPVVSRCADSSLLCVMRIGSNQPLYQCRSTDNGLTWSVPQKVHNFTATGISESQTYSVDPDMCLMSSGVLALVFGRPNNYLLLSKDGNGNHWDTCLAIAQETWPGEWGGYMGVRETSPNRLLIVGENRVLSTIKGYVVWGKFVSINEEAMFSSVSIVPSNPAILSDHAQQFSILAFDQYGDTTTLSSSSITWSVTGGGAIDSSGLFIGGSAVGGPYTVSVSVTAEGVTKLGATQILITSGEDRNTFESDTLGQTPAGYLQVSANGIVSDSRAYGGAQSLRVFDNSSSILTCIVKYGVPDSSKTFEEMIYPFAAPNGNRITINSGANDNDHSVFHIAISATGALQWYNGNAWTVIGNAGTVTFGAWNKIRIEVPTATGADIYINDILIGTAGNWHLFPTMDRIRFLSGSTPGTGDDFYLDDVCFGDFCSPPSQIASQRSIPVNPLSLTISSDRILYFLPTAGQASISIYNIDGRMVGNVASGFHSSGKHEASWKGKGNRGEGLTTGVYLVKLKAGRDHLVKKMIFCH